jgi:ubiquinone/menaquinone biosynthesis C-methylase UbiE
MQSLSGIKNILRKPFARAQKLTNPEDAYNLWAASYDSQPDNLMLALDEHLFSNLIQGISLKEKMIADIGCGTGRHWRKLMSREPKKLIGFDVSDSMLAMLKNKFPHADTKKLNNNFLIGLENESIDIIISTLTIAHIENAEEAFNEWGRVLKPNGEIIITDYHPAALSKGGNRTFKYNDETVAVKNNIYPVSEIKKIFEQLGMQVLRIIEKKIDESVKHYYEKHNALHLYQQFQGIPIIYGIHLKKLNAAF